jgi:hypothetical protein
MDRWREKTDLELRIAELQIKEKEDARPQPSAALNNDHQVRIIMQVSVSILLLIGGLFVILAKRYRPSDRHWAYATVGTIVGYWLKG